MGVMVVVAAVARFQISVAYPAMFHRLSSSMSSKLLIPCTGFVIWQSHLSFSAMRACKAIDAGGRMRGATTRRSEKTQQDYGTAVIFGERRVLQEHVVLQGIGKQNGFLDERAKK